MKVPISWLKDYVDIDGIPIEELAHKLTMAGLEVEEIHFIGLEPPPGDRADGARSGPCAARDAGRTRDFRANGEDGGAAGTGRGSTDTLHAGRTADPGLLLRLRQPRPAARHRPAAAGAAHGRRLPSDRAAGTDLLRRPGSPRR